MERSETLSKFEPLRKKYKKWVAPVLTSAEQAQYAKAQETVETVAERSVEDFLERGSKLPLDLNSQVTGIVEKLQGELGTLDDTQLAVNVVEERLEEARNVRVAADSLEVLTQEGKRDLETLQEEFEAKKAEDEAEFAEMRESWKRHDAAHNQRVTAETARVDKQRNRLEEEYEYARTRAQRLAEDERTNRKEQLLRDLSDRNKLRTLNFEERETELMKLEAENEGLQEKVTVLKERLETEPQEARSKAISDATNQYKSEANAVKAENDAVLSTKQREIEVIQAHSAYQQAQIIELEKKVAEATEHNKTLSQLAMGQKVSA